MQVNSKLCAVGSEQRSGTVEFVKSRVDRSLSRFGRDSMGLMQLYWRVGRRSSPIERLLSVIEPLRLCG